MTDSQKKASLLGGVLVLALGSVLGSYLFFSKEVTMSIAIIVFHFVLIFGVTELVRRYKWLVYTIYVILPLISLPVWLSQGQDWFVIAKTYTIIVYMLWIQLTRDVKKYQTSTVMIYGIYGLLIFNILEAMLRDFQTGYYLNVVSGLILCITIPTFKKISVDTTTKWRDLHWEKTVIWMIFYAIWNVTFVYSTFPYGGAIHIAVNLVPLVIGLYNPKIWIQARVISLATHMMLRIYFSSYNDAMLLPLTADMRGVIQSISIMHVLTFALGLMALGEVAVKLRRKKSAMAFQ